MLLTLLENKKSNINLRMSTLISDNEVTGDVLESGLNRPQVSTETSNSYGQILKSSALIGGSQVLNIGIGIVRTKIIALILGPAGLGLAGVYNSIVDLTQNMAGMGVNSSGVRQIAEAVGSGDAERIRLTVAILRKTSLVLGGLGAVLLILFSRQVSLITFGTEKHVVAVCVLSIAVFCKLVSGGQGALIQGMRHIAALAKMNVFGAAFGAIAGIALVYAFRENGIVMYVVALAVMAMFMSWWYSRKIRITAPRIAIFQARTEAAGLLKLGFAFMISSLMTLGVAYAVRVILLRRLGLQATGLYQAAWTLGGMYVGFILQAMAADFYPRLTASIHDHVTCNRLVNEQAQVGLLLATPGVIVTLTFAQVVVNAFYSAHFAASVPVLRWICLGTTLQVISWPMGFIIVAKGKQNLFIVSEVAWAIVSLALAWFCIGHFGVDGAGIAFFGSYIFHVFMTYALVRPLSGFRWSSDNLRTGVVLNGTILAVFICSLVLPLRLAITLGLIGSAFSTIYSLKQLAASIEMGSVPGSFRRVLERLRLLPS